MHANRQVMAYDNGRTIIYPSETEAMDAYGIKSTSQLSRLIRNEQNVPHMKVWLDWWEGEPVRIVTDTTEDMMSDAHRRKMRRAGVRILPRAEA